MDILIYLIIYVIAFCYNIYILKKRIKKDKFIGAYSGFLLAILLYYIIVPSIIYIFGDFYFERISDYHYERIIKYFFGEGITSWERIRAILVIFIAILGLEFGYKLKMKKNISTKNENIYSYSAFESTIRKIAYSTLGIGVISVIIYIFAFGGLSNALNLSEILRQHYSSLADYGKSEVYSYFLVLSGILTITPILFYYLWKKDKKGIYFVFLVFSFIFTGIYLLLNSGKSAVLRLAIIFFFLFLEEKDIKHKMIAFIGVVVIGLPLMDCLDALFAKESITVALKNFSYLYCLREFAIPAELTFNMGKICSKYGYMYFKHFVLDFLNILPGLSFSSSFANTSEFMRGANWMRLGGTPNDLITYGFLQLRVVGVFVVCSIWGRLSRWFDNIISAIPDELGRKLIGITVCMNMVSVVTCADISSTILYNLPFIITFFILFIYSKKIKVRERSEKHI